MKKTVIYIGSFFLPDKSAGAQRALSLSKSFRDLGYKVVLVGMNAEQNREIPVISTKKICEGFECYSISQPKTINDWIHHTISIKEYIEVVNLYKQENVFAIIAMEYEAIALYKLTRYCKKNDIKLIADAEEWYEHSNLNFPISLGKDLDTFLRMRIVYPFFIDNMICISRFFYEHYKGRIKNRVIVPGTIDLSQEKWSKLPEYKPNSVFRIGYAGHPGLKFEKERLDWLIDTVYNLNIDDIHCELFIAGLEYSFFDERDIYIDKKVINCLGKVSHFECLKMVTACDCTVIVRENKRVTNAGFPTKFSESLGCGTPVITTPSSNIAEFIIEAENGFVTKSFDKKGIYDAIKKIAINDNKAILEMHRKTKEACPLQYSCFNKSIKSFLCNL